MKFEIYSKFSVGQTVWIVCKYDDGFYKVEKHEIIGIAKYFNSKETSYILSDEDNLYDEFFIYDKYKDAVIRCKYLNKLYNG